ncbi:MAG: thiamine pyrophosphate-dependent enzyme [Acidobacteriota bacterium]|jgi:indolepyruvate ferredoxin oxidoreductase alpha subunit
MLSEATRTRTGPVEPASEPILLGDEAVALAAIHAGIAAAYAYPGTPSTEILEYLIRHRERHGAPHAAWTANEKTAYETALGTSLAGRRALVAMKHVGLNVAADPFLNSALVAIQGGLVVAVADDPGMHSSQNEQDSRYYADFAHVPCLEPANHQEAYDMAREAFGLSERFRMPVLLRLVTRLAHSRAPVRVRPPDPVPPAPERADTRGWTLLPAFARRQWHAVLERQRELRGYVEVCDHNRIDLQPPGADIAVVTTGIARTYYLECAGELERRPSHLHIGAYPFPAGKLEELARGAATLLVLEEGYPFLERYLRGVLPGRHRILGRATGHVPADGELGPDAVRAALGLPIASGTDSRGLEVPARSPQLCAGCPHRDTFEALNRALEGFPDALVTSDIGCYTLGALPPYEAIHSCVCMGASIGMAKGAAEAGLHPVVATIGDSTFLHSGVTPLLDAVTADADLTLIILDNRVVAMTGGQPTILEGGDLEALVLGLGVDPAHVHRVEAHPKKVGELADRIRREIEHRGLSVIIAARECIESARKRKRTGGTNEA